MKIFERRSEPRLLLIRLKWRNSVKRKEYDVRSSANVCGAVIGRDHHGIGEIVGGAAVGRDVGHVVETNGQTDVDHAAETGTAGAAETAGVERGERSVGHGHLGGHAHLVTAGDHGQEKDADQKIGMVRGGDPVSAMVVPHRIGAHGQVVEAENEAGTDSASAAGTEKTRNSSMTVIRSRVI